MSISGIIAKLTMLVILSCSVAGSGTCGYLMLSQGSGSNVSERLWGFALLASALATFCGGVWWLFLRRSSGP